MAAPLVVDLPHSFGRDEARRRMHARADRLASALPGGVASVKTSWPGEDRMAIEVVAMGQTIAGTADVGDSVVRLTLALPGMLGMMAGPIAAAIKGKGGELLLGDDGRNHG